MADILLRGEPTSLRRSGLDDVRQGLTDEIERSDQDHENSPDNHTQNKSRKPGCKGLNDVTDKLVTDNHASNRESTSSRVEHSENILTVNSDSNGTLELDSPKATNKIGITKRNIKFDKTDGKDTSNKACEPLRDQDGVVNYSLTDKAGEQPSKDGEQDDKAKTI